MRLSESLRRGILETAAGGIANRFKLYKRRDVLFFADIFTNYIRECEKSGYHTELENVGERWMLLYFSSLVPSTLKAIPLTMFFNSIMKRVWINLGLLEDLHVERRNDVIRIETKNESITNTIGKNGFLPALYAGALSSLSKSRANIIEVHQTTDPSEYNTYLFRLEGRCPFVETKDKIRYNKLNSGANGKHGLALTDALTKKILEIRDNRIYFRGRQLTPLENTLFHLIGNSSLPKEPISRLSHDFFSNLIDRKAEIKNILRLLKTILQVTGWGIPIISLKNNKLSIRILHPPYGLQKEEDNWTVLIMTILGYLSASAAKKVSFSSVSRQTKSIILNYLL